MGWLSKTFGGVGDFLEDYGVPIVGGIALGALTGGLGAWAAGAIGSGAAAGAGAAGAAAGAGAGAAAGTAAGTTFGAAMTSGTAILGGVIGGVGGAQLGQGKYQADKAAASQLAAAEKLAAMQDPSRLVQQNTPAQAETQQAQVNEINNATAQARKLTVAKMNYNSGLGGFSSFGASRTDKLG